MSEVGSHLSDDNDVTEMLAERENELENLLSQMDQLQSEVDEYHQKLSEMNLEVAKSKQEQAKIKLINRNIGVEPAQHRHKKVNDDLFEGEHLDLIKSKRDEIAHLTEQINQLQIAIQPIDDLVADLQQQNAILLCEKSSTQSLLQKLTSDKKRLTQDCIDCQDHIRELNVSILNQERVAKDVETIVGGLIQRRDAIYSQSDPKSELQQKIKALRVQTELLQIKNEEMQDDIANFEDNINEYQSDIDYQLKTMKGRINWDREKTKLQSELTSVQKQLEEKKSETKEIITQINASENRLKKLKPIIQKWSNEFRTRKIQPNDDEDIDALLAQCKKTELSSTKTNRSSNQELTNLIIENEHLEAKINSSRELLAKAMNKFALEKAELKKEIKNSRTKSFEDEHQFVEQIKKLKIKSARIPQRK
ncbi:hypothetical protein TRFO_05604 [Tritrichomonas foetus]|uniref:Uncharacterized protein n=1 Tax=Tritrichomonas foetus TaxID=1144522 RepID=A0A1J4K4M9_9EUKA|nr:hypothetical protein TRFO_05604 [Tritrichomonas foetus]|eukprot:OHT06401.1 hypothetical protein TRFO_05604 [Tritrichomonas foetus]